MSHTMKVWERNIETRLRDSVEISKQQYGFIPGKGTTDAMFALRMLMEKYREGQRELHCVFVDLEKAYDRVPREELRYYMRKSGIVEKYVQLVQDMYEGSETLVRCAVRTTESFKVKVGLHQGSALSPFLFAVIMDRLTDKVKREPPWTMLFAEDIVICEETREELERRVEEMEVAEMKMLRFAMGVTKKDKIRNEHIRSTVKVERLGMKMREGRLRWYGYVMRRDQVYVGRKMMEMELPGKRRRGRPKRRFLDVVKKDMGGVDAKETDVEDRKMWK